MKPTDVEVYRAWRELPKDHPSPVRAVAETFAISARTVVMLVGLNDPDAIPKGQARAILAKPEATDPTDPLLAWFDRIEGLLATLIAENAHLAERLAQTDSHLAGENEAMRAQRLLGDFRKLEEHTPAEIRLMAEYVTGDHRAIFLELADCVEYKRS